MTGMFRRSGSVGGNVESKKKKEYSLIIDVWSFIV
jgi:hypothetical protein